MVTSPNNINFSQFHLIINDESPTVNILRNLFDDKQDTFKSKSKHYIIHKKNIDDEYFWFYINYGACFPHSPTILDSESEKEEENPRTTTQIETNKQFFLLYSVKNKTLYLSNRKKRHIFEKYLTKKLSQNVTIKAFFKNVDQFIEKIRHVEQIKFVAKNDLFNADNEIMKIFPTPTDLYGLGMPESYSLEAVFQNAPPTDHFVSFLRKMVHWKKSAKADSLVCIGRDDKNIETIFNVDSFIQKTPVPTDKNDQGMYEPQSVMQVLIQKIKDGTQ